MPIERTPLETLIAEWTAPLSERDRRARLFHLPTNVPGIFREYDPEVEAFQAVHLMHEPFAARDAQLDPETPVLVEITQVSRYDALGGGIVTLRVRVRQVSYGRTGCTTVSRRVREVDWLLKRWADDLPVLLAAGLITWDAPGELIGYTKDAYGQAWPHLRDPVPACDDGRWLRQAFEARFRDVLNAIERGARADDA